MIRLNAVAVGTLCSAAFTFALSAYADIQEWTVVRATNGAEQLQEDGSWVVLERGERISSGADIRTGKRARLKLKRGDSVIQVRPNTTLRLPAQDANDTRIYQMTGVARYTVEKRSEQHFSVETPYLAAVVKGTEFDVRIEDDSSEVRVREGIVEVGDYDTGERVLLNRRARAETRHTNGAGLGTSGDADVIEVAAPAASPVEAVPARPTPQIEREDTASRSFHPTAGYRGMGFGNTSVADAEVGANDYGAVATTVLEEDGDASAVSSVADIRQGISDQLDGVAPGNQGQGLGVGGTPAGLGAGANGDNNGVGIGGGGTPPGLGAGASGDNNGVGIGGGGTPPGLGAGASGDNNGVGIGGGGTPPGLGAGAGNGNNGVGLGVGGTPPGQGLGNGNRGQGRDKDKDLR